MCGNNLPLTTKQMLESLGKVHVADYQRVRTAAIDETWAHHYMQEK
jgi:hypothetical protein